MILLIFVRRCRVFSLELMSIEVPGSSWKLVSTLEGVLVPRGGYWLSQALTSNLSSLPIRFVVFMFAVHSTCMIVVSLAEKATVRQTLLRTDTTRIILVSLDQHAIIVFAEREARKEASCHFPRYEGGKKGGKKSCLPLSVERSVFQCVFTR